MNEINAWVVNHIREVLVASPKWAQARQRLVAAYGQEYESTVVELALKIRGVDWVGANTVAKPPRPASTEANPPAKANPPHLASIFHDSAVLSDADKRQIAISLALQAHGSQSTYLNDFRRNRWPVDLILAPTKAPPEYRASFNAAYAFSRSSECRLLQKAYFDDIALKERIESSRRRAEISDVKRSNWSGDGYEPSPEAWREQP